MNEIQLKQSFNYAVDEFEHCFETIQDISVEDISGISSETQFYCAMLCRMITSALIDADRRDTALFMSGKTMTAAIKPDWKAVSERVEKCIDALQCSDEVNMSRREISDICAKAAAGPDGIHRLSVPTGGGKTLTALRYSLKKAESDNRNRRIFFVVPLLSVLEQNAKVIRDFVGDDSMILEHHSNVVQDEDTQEQLERAELLTETWDSPIIITTLVQLLNTLFSGKTSCLRRMQALADSIIVIDEVQTVPHKLLSQFNLAMNFLSKICGAEIVLCSATQPCLEKTTHAIIYEEKAELVQFSEKLSAPFRRTRIIDCCKPGGDSLENIGAKAIELLEETNSLLIICNLKSQAEQLYNLLKGGNAEVFHLSAAMCMAHRQDALNAVNEHLNRMKNNPDTEEKIICVATQLVEAGVDFSFGTVIRIIAGMDNIVQAAGRCNRNGEFQQERPVYIMNVHEERLGPLKEISQAQNATENLLCRYAQDSNVYNNDLASEKSIRDYYCQLFITMAPGKCDFPMPKLSTSVYSLLSLNEQFAAHCANQNIHGMKQAFRTAGEKFMVFDENTTDVLVPYRNGAECIADLNSERAKYDLQFCADVLKKSKPYTVSLYENQMKRLRESGGIIETMGGTVLALSDNFYDNETGVRTSGNSGNFLEV